MSLPTDQGLGLSILNAFFAAFVSACVFAIVFPFVTFALIVGLIPGVTAFVYAVAELPTRLFGFSLPENDKMGSIIFTADAIYAGVVFVTVFAVKMFRTRRSG